MELEEFGAYLKALPAKIESAAPAVVAETAVEYYKERFKEKAFDGAPWVPGRPKKSGSLLVQSGNLMNSIRPDYVGPDKVIISAGNAQVPYAKEKDAGDAPGTVKAHTRHMKIPQRQFMGDARELSDRIKDRLNAAISSIL